MLGHSPQLLKDEIVRRPLEAEVYDTAKESYNFEQHLVYATSRIRRELGFREVVSYEEGIRRTMMATPPTTYW